MIINKLTVNSSGYPPMLGKGPNPPRQIFHAGAPLDTILQKPRVAIVGSRRVSPYGRQVTYQLARQLAERGIVIISGMAIGVDSIAHQAALDGGGITMAVLPGSLERIHPQSHTNLAARIIKQGGALISEYPKGAPTLKYQFIERNRLVAGLSQAVLITEAAEKSGSLHTARFARDQNIPVLAVPGNITSPGSAGTNFQIKEEGALLVTNYADVLKVLKVKDRRTALHEVRGQSPEEQSVLDLLTEGIEDSEELIKRSGLTASQFNQVLTMLEIDGKIRTLGDNKWAIV